MADTIPEDSKDSASAQSENTSAKGAPAQNILDVAPLNAEATELTLLPKDAVAPALQLVDDEVIPKKKSTEDQIEEDLVEIQEMIAFLDYSFERAFTLNEKNYILAYKKHALKIQTEIDDIRNETFDSNLQQSRKNKKIEEFQRRLAKIKACALFMGDMSEFHNQAIKKLKGKDAQDEDEIRFYEEMLHKERVTARKNRQELSEVSNKFDRLYLQAQAYLKEATDRDKISELLSLFDEEHRTLLEQQLPSWYKASTTRQKEVKEPFDFSSESLKKFQHVKVANFLQQMMELNLPDDVFARQIDHYFRKYQVPRKQTQINQMKQKVSSLKQQIKSIKSQRGTAAVTPASGAASAQKSLTVGSEFKSQLYHLFMEHLRAIKDEIRQRKMLNKLKNAKVMRTQQIEVMRIDDVMISHMKAQDKKKLLYNFFSDPRAIEILVGIVNLGNGPAAIATQFTESNRKSVQLRKAVQGGGGKNLYQRILHEPTQSLVQPRVGQLMRPQSGSRSLISKPSALPRSHDYYGQARPRTMEGGQNGRRRRQTFGTPAGASSATASSQHALLQHPLQLQSQVNQPPVAVYHGH